MRSRLTSPSIAPFARAARALTLALALGGALLVAAPSGPAAATDIPGPAYQQPINGSCHTYARSQLRQQTEDSAPVDCAGPHTAQTVAVLSIKPGLSGAKAAARYLPECYAATKLFLGRSEKRIVRTAYEITLFRPNDAQLAQGARWARCDLVLPGGNRLEQLPTPLLAPKGKIPSSVLRCAKNGGQQTTVCSRPHTQRAGLTIKHRQKAYPSRRTFLKIARRCGRGATLAYPGKVQWKGGIRASVCLVPDRKKK